jgi:hypothetical protein
VCITLQGQSKLFHYPLTAGIFTHKKAAALYVVFGFSLLAGTEQIHESKHLTDGKYQTGTYYQY